MVDAGWCWLLMLMLLMLLMLLMMLIMMMLLLLMMSAPLAPYVIQSGTTRAARVLSGARAIMAEEYETRKMMSWLSIGLEGQHVGAETSQRIAILQESVVQCKPAHG